MAKRALITGITGQDGAMVRCLEREGAESLILCTHTELDLTDQDAVDAFFAGERPDYVFLCAAIHANDAYPAECIRDNLATQTNAIHAAWKHGARKLLFLGSSCIYPNLAPQSMREDALLTGPLEPTNEWHAIATLTGLKMCQAYRKQDGFDTIVAMPANLCGSAHVVDYTGTFKFDPSKPDGSPRKLLDTSRLRELGWAPRINFASGLADAYATFLAQPRSSC